MPTIQSKKYPDNIQFVDVEAWNMMKEKGLARRFNIIDDGDIAETVIAAPEEIINFSDAGAASPDDTVEKVLSREEIKAELDKHEQEYNTRVSTDKLQEQLNSYLESL